MGTKGLGSKRIELLKENLPSARRLVLVNPDRQQSVYFDEYKHAAKTLGMELEVVNPRSHAELEPAFVSITKMGPDAIFIQRNNLIRRHRSQIGDFILENRLPTMGDHRMFAEIGGIMSYGVNYPANWQRAAVYVDKVLKGANPATLPVEPPRLELVINLKSARTIGVTVPPEVLLEAREVFN